MRFGNSLLCALLVVCGLACHASKIQRVVVLMEENRSFDHMLGFLQRKVPGVDGLTGKEYNIDPVSKKKIGICECPLDVCPTDLGHGYPDTLQELFNVSQSSGPAPKGQSPNMGGFVWNVREHGHSEAVQLQNPLAMWNTTSVPIISTLASEFAVFDQWHCSVPGPTYPNREFVHSATSVGNVGDGVPKQGYTQETVFDRLDKTGHSWKVYYDNTLVWIIFMTTLRSPAHKANLVHMDEFYKDCREGTLPHYAFIQPRLGPVVGPNVTALANHQHPVASVREGERLMKDVYEAMRNGPQWNESLFLLTYDEHGGFYDHVPPPSDGVPNPDGVKSSGGFNFDRLGLRVPTIAISPWIDPQVVHRPPPAQSPTSTSQYEHSSVPATLNKLFGTGFLTARDRWAGTFEHLWAERTTPRTDCPTKLPDVPPPKAHVIANELSVGVQDTERDALHVLCDLNGWSADRCAAKESKLTYSWEAQKLLNRLTSDWLAK